MTKKNYENIKSFFRSWISSKRYFIIFMVNYMSKEKSSNYLDIKSDIALSISGKSNSNPSSINRLGKTETLWVRTLEPLPNNNLSCHSKRGTIKGLLRALARALPKYFCWMGVGDVTLYIPDTSGLLII